MNYKVIEYFINVNLAVKAFPSSSIAASGLSSTDLDDFNNKNVPISENVNDAVRDDDEEDNDDKRIEPDNVTYSLTMHNYYPH